jgi:protein-tyrosine phosphatase
MRTFKTSLTHPLPLASVSPLEGNGRILFTMCPGKVQPEAVTGPWERDLDIDMDAVADAGVTAMLTLMDDDELQTCALSSTKLEDACRARSIQWHQGPIEDFKIPNKDWETAWQSLGEALRGRLGEQESILIQCRGGRGRAGMIAARLLVELGMAHGEAITRVRAEREEAIETPQQEEHIHGCRPF